MALLGAATRKTVGAGAAIALVLALIGYGLFTVFHGGNDKHLTAYFPRTIGLYKGSAVDVLGVPVGSVTRVHPEGTRVRVELEYDASRKLPANVGLTLVPPSVVADRYVQLGPAYTGGAVLPNNATIQEDHVQIPVELDQIFGSVSDLSAALGPNGANKNGALSQLINVAAANLNGNGQDLHDTLKGVSDAVSALSDSKDSLFGTITSLQKFTSTLAADDGGVRQVSQDLTAVSGQLAGERQDLGAALSNLATALNQVQSFVADNRTELAHDVGSLTTISSGLVNEKQAITEVLDEAPLAVYNLLEATSLTNGDCGADLYRNGYQGCYGVLQTRARLDPTTLITCLLGGLVKNTDGCVQASGTPTTTTGPTTPTVPGVPTLPTLPTLPGLPSLGGLGGLLGGLGLGSGGTTPKATSPPSSSGGLGGFLGNLFGSSYTTNGSASIAAADVPQPADGSLAAIWMVGTI
jgi:phospholipid/cholesterol/gamma-HCH transport system substrate-binding protein